MCSIAPLEAEGTAQLRRKMQLADHVLKSLRGWDPICRYFDGFGKRRRQENNGPYFGALNLPVARSQLTFGT